MNFNFKGGVMKKKILLLMLVLMFISTSAQSQSFIYGQIEGIEQKGHTVELYKSGCGGYAYVDTSTTNLQGDYFFENLTEGSYTVGPVSDDYQFNPNKNTIKKEEVS